MSFPFPHVYLKLCFSLKLRLYALGPTGGPSNPTERCQSALRCMKQSLQCGGVGQPSSEMKVGFCMQRDASQRPSEYASLEDGRGCWWHHLHPKHLCGRLTGDARDKWRLFTLRASQVRPDWRRDSKSRTSFTSKVEMKLGTENRS